ncbi:3-deoxy-manno-octulosonate cytidylyltransferase [Bacillus coahuilensis m2-6]|uniref:3-deoxy-manno-octulosonate cytidylyltransferase n=1 Tax=Bacillus coahuilensis TaxID=408580 RepID=UPI0007503614|nr:3-deoxy-manno-octulosonate cytidylyltransferase [Bacillus coahuilensis]KUP05557.1 3-deoxy-manno-octulosonate cytidylyltransferase [Bacillus coahuilensis m2-6]
MKVTVIIPARYGSSRLPGKPLINILDKPMIHHVYENCKKSSYVNRVIVATDDQRIKDTVESFGGECFLTSVSHQTGTDRIAEVAEQISSDIILNVQGDEPLLKSTHIDELIKPLLKNEKISMATLKTRINSHGDIHNVNIVKVITNKNNEAIYFSRSPIPYNRENNPNVSYYKHVGIYAYRKKYLLNYKNLKESMLEDVEILEQLRAIENGDKIYIAEIFDTLHGVDVEEDIKVVENKMRAQI